MGEFAAWLRSFLDSRSDLNQKKLAELLGVSPPTVSAWINDKYQPNDKNIAELAKIAGITRNEIRFMLGRIDLDPDEDVRPLLVREIERLLAKLPPEDQEEIREMARLKAERRRREQEQKGQADS